MLLLVTIAITSIFLLFQVNRFRSGPQGAANKALLNDFVKELMEEAAAFRHQDNATAALGPVDMVVTSERSVPHLWSLRQHFDAAVQEHPMGEYIPLRGELNPVRPTDDEVLRSMEGDTPREHVHMQMDTAAGVLPHSEMFRRLIADEVNKAEGKRPAGIPVDVKGKLVTDQKHFLAEIERYYQERTRMKREHLNSLKTRYSVESQVRQVERRYYDIDDLLQVYSKILYNQRVYSDGGPQRLEVLREREDDMPLPMKWKV